MTPVQIVQLVLWIREHRVFQRWRERRQLRRALRKGVSPMMKGYLTYISIAATAVGAGIGLLHLPDCTPDQVAQFGADACQSATQVASSVVEKVAVVLGTICGLYGRWRATRGMIKAG